jgi:hypothetical protein
VNCFRERHCTAPEGDSEVAPRWSIVALEAGEEALELAKATRRQIMYVAGLGRACARNHLIRP